jgi:hypothetical protein
MNKIVRVHKFQKETVSNKKVSCFRVAALKRTKPSRFAIELLSGVPVISHFCTALSSQMREAVLPGLRSA